MTRFFLFRLFLDCLAAGLLLVAMAYYAFDNTTHEIIGTAMFLLLVVHNIFNRRWYGTITKSREARGIITKTVNLSLLVSMLALLVTSLVISKTLFSFLPFDSTFTARQIHTMVAYLALLFGAVHLGLHWKMIMSVVRSQLGITSKSDVRTVLIRAFAILGAVCGFLSLMEVEVGQKLLMQTSFDFGDLQIPTAQFILSHAAIVWLGASVGHYGLWVLSRRHRAEPAAGQRRRGCSAQGRRSRQS